MKKQSYKFTDKAKKRIFIYSELMELIDYLIEQKISIDDFLTSENYELERL